MSTDESQAHNGQTLRRRWIFSLLDGARAVLRHREFEHAARVIFDACKSLIGATAGYVAILDQAGRENNLVFLDPGGLSCTVDPGLPMPIRGLRAQAYKTKRAVYDNRFSTSRWARLLPDGHAELQNVLFAPLILEGRAVGLLGLANKPGGFTQHDVDTATTFGEFAALALHNHRTLNALERREQLFRSIVETARDAIISIDHLGQIVLWNRGAEILFGFRRDEILGKPLTRIIPQRLRKQHRKRLARAVETQQLELLSKTVETVGLRKDGTQFPVELSLAVWTVSNDVFFTGIVRDTTDQQRAREALERAYDELEKRVVERTEELLRANRDLKAEIAHRKQAQEAARQSRRQYRELWDNAPVAYHTLDTRGNITRVNATEAAMLGYTREEMSGRSIFDFILPEQQQEARHRFALKLSGQKVPKHTHRVYVRKDGSRVNVSIDDVLEYDERGEVAGIRTTMVDITSQKKAEQDLQESREALRRLSARLLRAQEDERTRIAAELHDSIGQSLAAIKFVAESARNQMDHQDVKGAKESLIALIALVQEASDEVRRIHTDLRPSLLDDLGILSTISWFCREFAKVYQDIRVEKQFEIEENAVPQRLKIIIFRILQEAMNNVSKHSRARRVRVSISKRPEGLQFMVKDDGRGFNPDKRSNSKDAHRGFGLAGMKERTELSGGRFMVDSVPGSGTTIRALWPI